MIEDELNGAFTLSTPLAQAFRQGQPRTMHSRLYGVDVLLLPPLDLAKQRKFITTL